MQADKRADLTAEREAISRNDETENDEGRDAALTRLDGKIKALCTHDSIYWNSRATDDGRIITTCERCNVSWYEHAG